MSGAEFVRHEWWCIWDKEAQIARDDPRYGTEMTFERNPETGERFANVLRLRNAKNADWLDSAPNGLLLRYEELAANPRGFVARLRREWGVRTRRWFRGVKEYKGARHLGRHRPRPYVPPSPEDVAFIVSQLDADLEARLGYDLAASPAARNGTACRGR